MKGKAPHLRKFISFLTKNSECPYNVKHKVWKSALNSAVLYSCETWISNDFKILDTPYLTTLKQMLGVRSTTCSDLIYIETGLPDVKSLIIDRQIKYLKCLRTAHVDDYIDKIIKMAIHHRTPMGRRLRYLETLHANVRTQCEMFSDTVSQRVLHSNTSRRQLYLLMNPSLEAHTSINSLKPSNPKNHIKEVHRISLTRMRLGSHHLRIETGRWSRTPRENRTCQCQESIQTEQHVLLHCSLSRTIRNNMNIKAASLTELFYTENVAEYCYRILNYYRTLH